MASKENGISTAVLDDPIAVNSEPTKKTLEFEDDDFVTVVWANWGMAGMPKNATTYLDRYKFVGGVGRRIPYKAAKTWKRQGNGIHILPLDATEADFIRCTGHAPTSDAELEALLRATPADKLAALLGEEGMKELAALTNKK